MGFMGFMGFYGIYPLVMTNKAVENGHRSNVCGLTNGGLFHSYVTLPGGSGK